MSSLLQGESRDEDHLYTDNYDLNWHLEDDDDDDALEWLLQDAGISREQGRIATAEQEEVPEEEQQDLQLQRVHTVACRHAKDDEALLSYLEILHEKRIITLESGTADSLIPKHPSLDVRGFTVNPTVPDGMFFAGYLATFVLLKRSPEGFRDCAENVSAIRYLHEVRVYYMLYRFSHLFSASCIRT